MAIDTRQKRQSAGLIGLPSKAPTVVPTGTIGAAQRQAAAWYYSGVLAGAVVVAPVVFAHPGDPPTTGSLIASRTAGALIASITTATIAESGTEGDG